MTAPHIAEAILLSGSVLFCWLGAIGAVRMRAPMQALQYLSLPSTIAAILLTVAVIIETRWTQTTPKILIILFMLIGGNAAVTHATARAFRIRELGHWEPAKGDDIEFVATQSMEKPS